MTYLDVIYQILNSAASIQLPFGFTLGAMVVFVFSIPLLLKFIKSIF